MNLSVSPCTDCTALRSHTFTSAGTFPMYARCSDAAGKNTNGSIVNVTATSPIIEHQIWQYCETGNLNASTFSNYSMGYKFKPNINMTVAQLCGRWPDVSPSENQRPVTLQDASFNPIASVSVTSSGGAWECEPITPPVSLIANSI